jgi:hypothetical protein
MKNKKRVFKGLAMSITFILLSFVTSYGSNNYVNKIPNGLVFSCENCHLNGFTNFSNDFVANNYTWNSTLAALDSDNDGYSNGVELQDRQGAWKEGDAQPGNSNEVTNPGNPASYPGSTTPTMTPTATPSTTPTFTPTATPTPETGIQEITIYTDKSFYKKDDNIDLYASLHVGIDPLVVDLYLVLADPNMNLYFFPSWKKTPDFFLTTLPANLQVDDVKIMNFSIPNIKPPINDEGKYSFYFAAAESGTTNFLGGIAQTTFEIFSKCPTDMITIEGGEFTMGDQSGWGYEDELPAHPVKLDSYCVDKFEYPNVEGDVPEYGKTYYELETACTEAGKRLCSEAEWERACTGPDNYYYPYGNDYNQAKCYNDYLSENSPATSGSYPDCKSGFDVYDMSGNVWEWTQDWYDADYYKLRLYDSPKGPSNGEYKVLKGGAWFSGKVSTRCSVRYVGLPDVSKKGSGGRCCK